MYSHRKHIKEHNCYRYFDEGSLQVVIDNVKDVEIIIRSRSIDP